MSFMNRAYENGDDPHQAEIAAAASVWLARRDRGLTPEEQDAFLHWLHEDPRHREALAHLQKTWLTLDALVEWQPSHSALPNPDLLAPSPRRRRGPWGLAFAGGLAAAALVVGLLPANIEPAGEPVAPVGMRVVSTSEREVLPDGSVAKLKEGGRYRVHFTESERRVLLEEGELFIAVAKNPDCPFVVEVDGVTVRAVGTAFNVRRGAGVLEVLVTEGSVQIESSADSGMAFAPAPVSFGERARVDLRSSRVAPAVHAVSTDEIALELAWQHVRLEFDALPLAAVASEFNLRNERQLRVADAETGRMRVTGTFQSDQVDGFVRLMEAGYALQATRDADGAWVLRRVSANQ